MTTTPPLTTITRHQPVSRALSLLAGLAALLVLPTVAAAAHHYVALAPENERVELAVDGSLRLNGAFGLTGTASWLVNDNSAVQAWFNGGASDLYLRGTDAAGFTVQGKSAKAAGGLRGHISTGRSFFLGVAGGLFLFNEKEYLGLDIAAFLGARFGSRSALTVGALIDIMVLDGAKVGGSKGLTSQFSMRLPGVPGLLGYAEFDVLKGSYPGSYFASQNLWLSLGVAKRF